MRRLVSPRTRGTPATGLLPSKRVDDMAVLGPTMGAELRLVGHDAGEIQVFISVA
jgi:hypothetical protein